MNQNISQNQINNFDVITFLELFFEVITIKISQKTIKNG